MDRHVKTAMIACTAASDDGDTPFPELVARLRAIGVERYDQDLVRLERTYYLPDGGSLVVPNSLAPAPVAPGFSAEDVEAAVRASQAGAIRYPEFCARIAAAGCTGYTVSLVGDRAVYHGRTGEAHVERFPVRAT